MTKNRETLKTHTHRQENIKTPRTTAKQHGDDKGHTHTTNQNPTTESTSRNSNIQGAKVYDLTKVAKHPPYQPITAAKHPPEANLNQHDGGGKASARPVRRQSIRQRRESDDQARPGRCRCNEAKAGAKVETLQGEQMAAASKTFKTTPLGRKRRPQAPSSSDE